MAIIKRPSYKLIVNGKDVTTSLKKYILGIEYTDAKDNEADGFKIRFHGENFAPPEYKDILKVWLGFEGNLWYIGSFSVLKSRLEHRTKVISITGTPVNFSTQIKEKRTQSYENVSLDQVLQKIAKRNDLSVKNSFYDLMFLHLSQDDQSDLDFMRKVASDIGATFAIKNDTILFRPKKGGDKESELPTFTIDADLTDNLYLEMLDKTLYNSGVASWQSTKENKVLSVSVGSGSPALNVRGSFQSEAEAMVKLKAELNKKNKGTVRGGFDYEGMNIVAGGKLTIKNLPNAKWGNGFDVQQVKHTWGDNGYTINVEFEN